ncbi:MAG: CaiB/BaiF CoA transferase family protein [Dehalococcoidia bacterium]
MSTSRLPLEGIRVLTVTLVWAGPHASQLLADWGAEVIRVEPLQAFQPQTRGWLARPSKDDVNKYRDWGYAFPNWEPGPRPWNRHPTFNVHARNQLAITLNLRTPEGTEIMDRLIALADVLIENNVPETTEKLGMSYDRLRRINPALIMVRMPGFGLDAPYGTYRCLGSHIDGVSGHTWIRGYPDLGPESREDVYFSDSAGGVNAALAVMMALRHRARTGKGQLIELAQVENFTCYLGEVVMDYMMNRRVQTTLGNRHRYLWPHGCYPCRGEDQWVTIAVSDHEEWLGLCRAMGSPPWAQEERFADELGWHRYQDEMDRYISEWTKQQDKYELMHLLQMEGVPAAALLSQAEVFEDPHFRDRGYFHKVTQRETGTHLYPGMAARLSRTPNSIRLPPVRLGEYNEYVYKELLGMADAEYRRLEEAGQVGMDYPPDMP